MSLHHLPVKTTEQVARDIIDFRMNIAQFAQSRGMDDADAVFSMAQLFGELMAAQDRQGTRITFDERMNEFVAVAKDRYREMKARK